MERVNALRDEAKRLRDLAELLDNPIIRNSLRTMANDCESFAREVRRRLNAVERADTRQADCVMGSGQAGQWTMSDGARRQTRDADPRST